ncbi:MAG: DUF4230 domain-containing protein [Tissierellales bacterium]|nr:DUF4230 domain-containing protein [Tissierellales bacterium]MBN2828631.1 DUF4230 domain-containing protein [Tissierellales bacterium]
MKKIGSLIKGVVVIAVIGVVLVAGYNFYINDQQPTIISTMDIQGTISDIGELATAEYGYTIAQTADKPNKKVVGFEIPFTNSQVMYSYEGYIKAGIAFNEIEVTVNEANKTIFVDLPDAKILSSEVDFESLIVYDEKYNPFNAFTFSDMNLSLTVLKETAEEAALSNGLLERATINAQSIIQTTVLSFYDSEEYRVEFY